tara:strand:+ start:390 stop:791 length:402 start_codon:yes stop_codon:yes gene_type:complete
MPNHCYNKISIYGDEASKIASELKSEDTVFDFSKVLPEPNYEEVEVKSTFPKEDEKDDFRMPKWWDWRVQNWGTKWNSYDDSVEIVDDETVEYTFNTAWSPPEPVIEKLREQYPDVSITAFYDEPGMEIAGYY